MLPSRRSWVTPAAIMAMLIELGGHTSTSSAYETSTTHPALTAQSALSSQLHVFLIEFGLPRGLFEQLKLEKHRLPQRLRWTYQQRIARLDAHSGYTPKPL